MEIGSNYWWFEDEMDLRGWRVTNNPLKTKIGTATDGEGDGSLIFPDRPELGALPAGTIILLITNNNDENDAEFPADDLDSSDRKLIFNIGNENLDATTDPDFGVRRSNEALVLLAPGATDSFIDDIGVDFIAEGAVVTPSSFGIAGDGVVFSPSFQGIGEDDGAVFTNDSAGGFVNDDGTDPDRDDDQAGPGGWIVDPSASFTGENPGDLNILTPGAPNTGQDLSLLIPGSGVPGWHFY